MVDLSSKLTAIVPNQLNDETGVTSAMAFLALTIPITIALNLAASVGTISAVGADAGETLIFFAGSVATECSFLLVGFAYVSLRSTFQIPIQIPNRDALAALLCGLGMSFGTAFLSLASTDAILPAIEILPGFMQYTNLASPTGTGLILAAVISLVVIGPAEEFFFRGVIQERLSTSLSTKSALSLASVVFALFHVYPILLLSPPLTAVVHMTLYYTLMGAIFGWVYIRTDTIVTPALVHGVFNAVIFLNPIFS